MYKYGWIDSGSNVAKNIYIHYKKAFYLYKEETAFVASKEEDVAYM